MRYLIGVLAIMVAGGLAATPAAGQVCRPADSTSASLIKELRRFASATSGVDKTSRDSLRLAQTAPVNVVLVSSESVCKKASAAYQATFTGQGSTPFSGKVYVIQVGSTYAVLDPALRFNDPDEWVVQIQDSHNRALSWY